ncbi:YidH family protein [Rhodococcus qingshengii]|uniref:YidH family protein n=1 Tax=Rhodococcus qingshengii TaxID=334542 RepID=UPI0035E154A4
MTESDPASDKRWPRWVYSIGEEPDYRFTFANERTFLAWIRAATALIAGGVALFSLDLVV